MAITTTTTLPPHPMLKRRKPIDQGLSIYFDLARILAAIIVLLHHVWPLIMPTMPLPWPGHEAVVVFFVLSGYVIAYTVTDPSLRLGAYITHRAARILSVAIPALLLAVVTIPFADGQSISYAGDLRIEADKLMFATLINGLFLAQSFGMNVPAPLNGPYWSICYEIWYYAIFAAWMYSSKRWRYVLTAIALALAGLKIVALLPVWLLGVWLFHRMPRLTERQAVLLFVVSATAAFAFYWSGASHIIRGALIATAPEFMASLNGSNQFIGDFILGLFVTANFAAVASLGSSTGLLKRYESQIRYASSYTLSTYLYHMPLTVLIWNGLGVRSAALFLLLLTVLIASLAMLTEHRIKFLRSILPKFLDRQEARRRRPDELSALINQVPLVAAEVPDTQLQSDDSAPAPAR